MPEKNKCILEMTKNSFFMEENFMLYFLAEISHAFIKHLKILLLIPAMDFEKIEGRIRKHFFRLEWPYVDKSTDLLFSYYTHIFALWIEVVTKNWRVGNWTFIAHVLFSVYLCDEKY